jgi:hypothetical protein
MKLAVLPKTIPGKLSLGLIGGLFLFSILLRLLVVAGQRGGATFFSNPALAVTGLLAAASGIGAFFTGIIAVIRSRERSGLVFLAVIIGLFVLFFCLGEILSPH